MIRFRFLNSRLYSLEFLSIRGFILGFVLGRGLESMI